MPDSNIELEPWTKFVQSQGLMEYKDGEYIITNKGLAFMLTWHFSIMKIGYGKKIGTTGLESVTYGLTVRFYFV